MPEQPSIPSAEEMSNAQRQLTPTQALMVEKRAMKSRLLEKAGYTGAIEERGTWESGHQTLSGTLNGKSIELKRENSAYIGTFDGVPITGSETVHDLWIVLHPYVISGGCDDDLTQKAISEVANLPAEKAQQDVADMIKKLRETKSS